MKKRIAKILAVGLIAAMGTMMLAGCGNSTGDKNSNTQAKSSGSTSAADVITIGVDSDWNDISPFGTMSTTRTAVKYIFYEYLAVRKTLELNWRIWSFSVRKRSQKLMTLHTKLRCMIILRTPKEMKLQLPITHGQQWQ